MTEEHSDTQSKFDKDFESLVKIYAQIERVDKRTVQAMAALLECQERITEMSYHCV